MARPVNSSPFGEKFEPPPEPSYVPPTLLVDKANHELAKASAGALDEAERLFRAYREATGGVSAVTGAKLSGFDECPPLVRYGWLCAARLRRRELPDSPVRTEKAS